MTLPGLGAIIGGIGNFFSTPTQLEPTTGPVAFTPIEGPLDIATINIPTTSGGVRTIPFNPGDTSLATHSANQLDSSLETAKQAGEPDLYNPVFLEIYYNKAACYADQQHGKSNPNYMKGCDDFAERGDMSKLVFTDAERAAFPLLDFLTSATPQDAKSDLIRSIEARGPGGPGFWQNLLEVGEKFPASWFRTTKYISEGAGSTIKEGVSGSIQGFSEGADIPTIGGGGFTYLDFIGKNTGLIALGIGGVFLLMLIMR